MTSTNNSIPHHRNCKRPAPILRLSWLQTPELFCPGCGRTAPADDARRTDR